MARSDNNVAVTLIKLLIKLYKPIEIVLVFFCFCFSFSEMTASFRNNIFP